MAFSVQPPLVAKNGRVLKVLGIARISTEHQDRMSLEDQEALYGSWLARNTDMPFELTMIKGKGSGESLQRKEVQQAELEVETGNYDLVIAEDLGRIFRRVHAYLFCECCEDAGTRLIAVNDNVDTELEQWRLNAFFATIRHEMYNADTGKRIRRSLRNRFSQGGVVQFVIYGYVKPFGAKSDQELQKDPAAEPVYDEWFRRLEEGAGFAEVADWLNDRGIPLGLYCRNNQWDGPMVSRITYNTILKGLRIRNQKVSKRVNKTGERRSVPAPPEEQLSRECPHMAFIEPARYDRIIRMLNKRNARHRRKGVDGKDTRKNVSKKRTDWPGQHLRCGVCGRIFVWTGTAGRKLMMCSGAHVYRCWNSVLINGSLVSQRLIQAILKEIRLLPGFDTTLFGEVEQKIKHLRNQKSREAEELRNRLAAINSKVSNLTEHVADGLASRSLMQKIDHYEQEQDDLQQKLDELQQMCHSAEPLPSLEQIQKTGEEALSNFVPSSHELSRLMRRLVPELQVYPYRLCDGGAVVLRAKIKLYLPALFPANSTCQGVEGILEREIIVDLFDYPQRVRYCEEVVRLRKEMNEVDAAVTLGITKTAAQRAAALDRMMKANGLEDPYLPVHSPPEDYGKLRRHKHPRYCFEPLQDQ